MSKSTYQLVASNPDGRRKDLFVVTCHSPEEVQQQVLLHEIEADHAVVFLGGVRVPITKRTIIEIGDQPRRRGRPLGSKNKVKKVKAKTVQSLLKKRREPKKVPATAEVGLRGKRAKAVKKEAQTERNARIETAA